MINQFLMEKRCCSRLEKYVSDRVWSEPYAELRTNTRPRILNAKKTVESTVGGVKVVTGYIYTAAAGVLTGTGEQVALPSSSLYYVYSIELNQFRSIKLNALEWVSLEEYCSGSRTDIKLYSDDGVMLWRGGIYIKQDTVGENILVAVDAAMLHRCMDKYTTNAEGKLVVATAADPSAVLFTKYVESDYVADDVIKCIHFDAYSIGQLKQGKSDIPANTRVMFRNGRVLIGDPVSSVKVGDYVECIVDADVVSDFLIHRSDKRTYLFNAQNSNSGRMLIHIPRNDNPDNLLLTYNLCDVYIIPKSVTTSALNAGLTVNSSGLYLHIGHRENVIHQLTHNDFSIDLSLLDEIAAYAGTDYIRSETGAVVTPQTLDYYVRVVVRSYIKKTEEDLSIINKFVSDKELVNAKFGAVRDANYCDLLYSEAHSDDTIIDHLLNNDPDSDLREYGMTFWSAAYLEANSMYAKAMMGRVGPTSPNTEHAGVYSAPVEKKFLSGKDYYTSTVSHARSESAAESKDLGNGIVSISPSTEHSKLTVTAGSIITDGTLELKEYPGKKVVPGTQCANCGLYEACALGGPRKTSVEVLDSFTEYECPYFSARGILDYVKILGYYNTLSLICRRVTTYYVKSLADDVVSKLKRVGKAIYSTPESGEFSVNVAIPEYTSMKNLITVHIPLALYDLAADEFFPMVYINGVKLDASKVHVKGYVDYDVPGMIEQHWTYTPSFGEDSLWEEEQRRLLIEVDQDINGEIVSNGKIESSGDYITVEVLPNPREYMATTDTAPVEGKTYYTKSGDVYTAAASDLAAFVEGTVYYERVLATSSTNSAFDLDETIDGKVDGVENYAFRPLGIADTGKIPLLQSELLYLNGKQLVAGIDYTQFSSYSANGDDMKTVIQNVQYLEDFGVNDDGHNHLNYTCTTDVTVGSAKGVVVGNWIPWDGISPFWFDNLSILTVGGRVCSNFSFKFSGLDIGGETHQNGEPFMVRTLVPKSVLDILTSEEIQEVRSSDDAKYSKLRAYFDHMSSGRGYRALIPYSHKVYSTYLLGIISAMLDGYDPQEFPEPEPEIDPEPEVDPEPEDDTPAPTSTDKAMYILGWDQSFSTYSEFSNGIVRVFDIRDTVANTVSNPRLSHISNSQIIGSVIVGPMFVSGLTADQLTSEVEVVAFNSTTNAEKTLQLEHSLSGGGQTLFLTSEADLSKYDKIRVKCKYTGGYSSAEHYECMISLLCDDDATLMDDHTFLFGGSIATTILPHASDSDTITNDENDWLSHVKPGKPFNLELTSNADLDYVYISSIVGYYRVDDDSDEIDVDIPFTTSLSQDGKKMTYVVGPLPDSRINEVTYTVTNDTSSKIAYSVLMTGDIVNDFISEMRDYGITSCALYWEALAGSLSAPAPRLSSGTSELVKFDFEMLGDPAAFKAQFARFNKLKKYDVVYNMTEDDRRFVDIYPIYHNLNIGSTQLKRKISYMVEMLSPSDEMRHREHINV